MVTACHFISTHASSNFWFSHHRVSAVTWFPGVGTASKDWCLSRDPCRKLVPVPNPTGANTGVVDLAWMPGEGRWLLRNPVLFSGLGQVNKKDSIRKKE